jgi:hypothetical protein
MICGFCGVDKLPGLFPPSEVRRVLGPRRKRKCIKCGHDKRNDLAPVKRRRGWAWMQRPLILTQAMLGREDVQA